MDKKLNVVLTQTHDHKPLATVRNLPGENADLTPDQMRRLAKALLTAADECQSSLMGRYFAKIQRSYDL